MLLFSGFCSRFSFLAKHRCADRGGDPGTPPEGPKNHACPHFLAPNWHKNAIQSKFSGFSWLFFRIVSPNARPLARVCRQGLIEKKEENVLIFTLPRGHKIRLRSHRCAQAWYDISPTNDAPLISQCLLRKLQTNKQTRSAPCELERNEFEGRRKRRSRDRDI